MTFPPNTITEALAGLREGDADAHGRLWNLVHAALRRLAGAELQGEAPDAIVQPTALVHEVYLRLASQSRVRWQDRTHFFRIATLVMRRLLIDRARSRRCACPNPASMPEAFLVDDVADGTVDLDAVLAVEEALTRFRQVHARAAELVQYRFFGGLRNPDIAEILGVSLRTVEGDWTFARAWLARWFGRAGNSEP